MALPTAFMEELRARTPLAAVIGRHVRLARSGRQWKGCCPFHGEKTPSFYVYDDHFHCFGCGAHGDAIGFVMQNQRASFMEAVELLAAEAGLPVPKLSPEAAEAERQRRDLGTVLQRAEASFQRRLFLPEGRAALDYLRGRGLAEETIRQFGLGWSGEGRGGLASELGKEGIALEEMLEAGIIRRDDATGRVYDLFFNRVMFPIRDRRGQTISFGGRLLGDGQPKYVNGPETALFSKRRNLYALDQAREAMRDGGTLVVVEGYMDVIALAQVGFTGAVAPLGTALTEEQMGELWRLSPSPVLCFDGDAAGARASARVAELVLPFLTPDKTLKLATLPAAEDPDSLIRQGGPSAFRAVLDAARPLSEALYELLHQGVDGESPEQRAAFRTRLEDAARRIPDRTLAGEYRRTLLDRFFAERRRDRTTRVARASPRGFLRPNPTADATAKARGRILTSILLRHPILLQEVDHAYAGLELDELLGQVRDALLDWAGRAERLDSADLMDHLTTSGLKANIEQVLAAEPGPLPACALPAAMPAEAEAGWWHIFGFLNVERLREEVAFARVEFERNPVPETQHRLVALAAALDKVQHGEPDGVELATI